jgi:hypothetical protein
MGLVLDLDLETNLGPSKEVFVSIDSIRVNKTLAEVKFSTSYWLDKNYCDDFFRKYHDDELRNAKGQVSQNIIYYDNDESDGEEVTLPNYFANVPLTKTVTVEQEVKRTIQRERKVPYVSFDEDGNEINLEKIIVEDVEEIVGTEVKERQVIDYKAINNIEEFCYIYLKKELGKLLPVEQLKTI